MPTLPDHLVTRDGKKRSWRLVTTILVGAVPFLIFAVWHSSHGPRADFGDYAQYLLHADALRNGRPYGDIGYIYTAYAPFIGPPLQPPGLPVALVPLLTLTGGARESVVYGIFMIGCVLAFLGATGAYLLRHGSRPLVVASLFVTGVWVEAGFATTAVQPDVIFAALVWLIFLVAERPGEWSVGRAALISALGLAAFAFRVAALPLIPAVALYALTQRRTVGTRAFIPTLIWCLCGVIAIASAPDSVTYARFLPRDPLALAGTVWDNLCVYPRLVLNLFLYPFPWNLANDVYHLVISLLAVTGALVWLPRLRHGFPLVFATFYVGMLFVMPIRNERYLMPLAPIGLYCASVGVAAGLAWVARLTWRELPHRLAARASLGLAGATVTIALIRELSSPRPAALADAPGATEVFARLAAARDSGTVRAVFINPRVLTWVTGVPAMGFFRAPADTTIAELRAKRITHVVLGDFHLDPGRSASMSAAVAAHPHAFRRLYQAGVFTVYAFDSTQALP